jgi:uncharacterized Ntn-hydrolase superfamily protein
VAAHTGSKCIPFAGHALGDHFSCQGNIMRTEKVWGAMRESFESNGSLPLPERLVAALEAAEAAGGDIRGKQSAAILVVSPTASANYWSGRIVDLRVEDHPQPLPELKRLLRYQRGYDWVSRGDDLLSSDDFAGALKAYEKGMELVPEVEELRYWVGLSMLASGEKERGLKILKEVFAKDKGWVQVTRGVLKTRSPPLDPALLDELLR